MTRTGALDVRRGTRHGLTTDIGIRQGSYTRDDRQAGRQARRQAGPILK